MKRKPFYKRCLCGCGRIVKPGNTWISGHNSKGKTNPMYGKTRPKEWCEGQSKRMKGRTKENNSGIAAMAEKMKIICSGEGNPMYGKLGPDNPNYGREAWNEGLTKDDHSGIARMVRKLTGRTKETHPYLAEAAKKMSGENHPFYGKKRPGHSKFMKEFMAILENKENLKQAWEKNFSDLEFRKRWAQTHHVQPNQLELEFQSFLNSLFPNQYKYVGDFQLMIGGKCPDFANCDGQKKLIELNGDYWHSEEVIGLAREEAEQERINHFKQYGFSTLVIWESDFQNNKDQIKQQLIEFHEA